jgi:hypothetical protein
MPVTSREGRPGQGQDHNRRDINNDEHSNEAKPITPPVRSEAPVRSRRKVGEALNDLGDKIGR